MLDATQLCFSCPCTHARCDASHGVVVEGMKTSQIQVVWDLQKPKKWCFPLGEMTVFQLLHLNRGLKIENIIWNRFLLAWAREISYMMPPWSQKTHGLLKTVFLVSYNVSTSTIVWIEGLFQWVLLHLTGFAVWLCYWVLLSTLQFFFAICRFLICCQHPQDCFKCLPEELQTADVKALFLQRAALMLGQNPFRFWCL